MACAIDLFVSLAEKVYHGWTKVPYAFIVVGPSGTGKTQLIRLVFGERVFKLDRLERTRITQTRRDATRARVQSTSGKVGKARILLVDSPGEDLLREERNKVWREGLKDVVAVLHVVANGYHETRNDDPMRTLVEVNGQKAPNPEFIRECLDREANDLSGWTDNTTPPTRLVTVVSKADLWWNASPEAREKVLASYSAQSGSPYGTKLSGVNPAHHEDLAFAAEVPGNFYECPFTGIHSQSDREEVAALKDKLITRLAELVMMWNRDHK